jgi:Leucine-rich repeat (LRR) protein
LDCDSNKLTALKLNNLSRLWSLSCINNLLTNLETEGLDSLALLYCFENYLTDINSLLLGLNPKKIVEIRISDNNFSDSDL